MKRTLVTAVILTLSAILLWGNSAMAEKINPYEDESIEQREARMKWWREARFGLFIHWGVYAVPAGTYNGKQIDGIGEWIMLRGQIPIAEYKEYAKQFNPVKYDPDAWVRLAKEAGMKYIVITSKHHDGFALFDSKVTDWDIVDATPYGKDLLKPLAEACRKHGLKLGFYYSQAQDWTHKGGAVARNTEWDPTHEGDMDEYIRNIAVPQVREILTNYGDLAVLWWDTPRNMNKERADMLLPLIALQPGIITNNRLGHYPGDLQTPEQHIPATGLDYDWETCMTMNGTWGFKSYDHNWKSNETLIRNLIDIASKGGNYLLNVGPTAEGEIPAPSIERLKAVGAWMKVNSEAIYATTASPFHKLNWGRCTQKESANGATLYLHVFNWPKDGKLIVPGLKNKVKKASMLDGGGTLNTARKGNDLVIDVPAEPSNPIATVIVLDVKGAVEVENVYPKAGKDGAIKLEPKFADIQNRGYTDHAKVEEHGGVPNIGYWTSARSWVSWAFKADKPGKYDVTMEVATEKDGNAVRIQLNGKAPRYNVKLPNTGGYASFKTVEVGRMTVDTAGLHTLEIRPIKKDWSAVNLRAVTLRPVK